jgi:hypothetical protein
MTQQIIMTVPRKGLSTNKTQSKFETRGFVGATCQQASDFLTKALGSAVADQPTAEMYDTEQNVERLSEGGE